MSTFLIILLTWAFVTAVGHATWLIFRAALAWLFSQDPGRQEGRRAANSRSEFMPESAPNPRRDMAAFERMVDALWATHAIEPQAAHELKQKARSLAGIELSEPTTRNESAATSERNQTLVEPEPLGVAAERSSEQSSEEASEHSAEHSAEQSSEQTSEQTSVQPSEQTGELVSTSVAAPFVASSAASWQASPRSSWQAPQARVAQPPTAKRALSGVIASFLAAHNIRWGELVAGLLIVICSIGLVVSLWNTITSSHRVVPSLIFMSADAAIFAAGLYTMRRWKLRHTSRAVLVIATLLVPLCVLAGLAAAGASVDSVSLGSPLTLASIGVGTLFCGWLLWQASLGLVGRGRSVPLSLSVAVPALCLPLLPAVARTLGFYAGSFLLVPAMATAIGLVLPMRRRLQSSAGGGRRTRQVGRRFWKNHWLHLGVAMASLASVVVYAAFLYQEAGRAAWIQIAIALVPVWVAVVMVHAAKVQSLSNQPRWATPRFVCSVLAMIAMGCVLAILPASIERVRWLWAHGITVAGSIVVVGWLLRGRPYLAQASVPIGMAAMLTSPAWLAGVDWSDVALWRTLLGGEPLIAALGLAALSGAAWMVTHAVRQRAVANGAERGAAKSLALVTAFWGAIAGLQAIVLSVAPLDWLGIMPVWGLASVLFAIMLMSAAAALKKPVSAWVCTLAAVGFWITCLGLVKWHGAMLTLDYDSAAWGLLGVAATMLAFAIGVKIAGVKMGRYENASVATTIFADSAAGFSVAMVCMLALLPWIARHSETVSVPGWGASAGLIAATSGLLAVAGLLVSKRRYLQLGMLVSAAAVFCGVTESAGVEIWQSPAWRNADALWSFAGVLAATAIGWQVVREGYRLVAVRRGWGDPVAVTWSRWRLPDGGMLLGTVVLLSAAVLWQYLAELVAPLGEPLSRWLVLESRTGLETLGRFVLLGCVAGGVWWCRYREPGQMFTRMFVGVSALTGLLLAMTMSERLTELASTRLVATTTLASTAVLAGWLASDRLRRTAKARQAEVAFESWMVVGAIGTLVSLGSAVLLWSNWWLPLSEHGVPNRLSTLAVAAWWMASSLGLLLMRSDRSSQEADAAGWVGVRASKQMLSAMLLPASIGISVPVFYQSAAVVWWQASVLGSVLWLALAWFLCRWNRSVASSPGETEHVQDRGREDQGILLSHVWIVAVGFGSAAMVLCGLVLDASWTVLWSLPLGGAASLVAIGSACLLGAAPRFSIDRNSILRVLPFVPAVMSGHAAVFCAALGWIDKSEAILVVMGCGLLGSIGSTIRVWVSTEQAHAWHVSVQSIALFALTILNGQHRFGSSLQFAGWAEWISLAGLASGAVGLMRFVPADHAQVKRPIMWMPNALGWFIVLAGGFLLLDHPQLKSSWQSMFGPTFLMAWTGACVVLWRSDRLTPRGDADVRRADVGVSAFLLPMLLVGGSILLLGDDWQHAGRLTTTVVMGLSQAALALLVAASAWLRPAVVAGRSLSMWTISMGLIAAGAAVGSLTLARAFQVATEPSLVVLVLAAMGALAMTVYLLPWLEKARSQLACRIANGPQVDSQDDRLGAAVERVVLAWVIIGSLISFRLAASSAEANWVRLSILGSAMAAWGLFQLAEQTRPQDSAAACRRRQVCVSIGLWTLALLAMLGERGATLYLLTATMRVLIVSVLAIGVLFLAIPRLLDGAFFDRWKPACRRGGILSGCVAMASLALMLGLEVYHRQGSIGIPQLAMPLVVVVAILLGGLALMAGMLAILSGPGFESRLGLGRPVGAEGSRSETGASGNWLRLDDRQRRWLLYVAQGIAGVTWLHLFLCRSGLAFAGLRQFWPYIVMVIAFASVGLTQWAMRRKDTVLAGTMQKTAMFLPLIPVVGFWLSGSYATMFQAQEWTWTFYRGTTSYVGLLVVGTIYYAAMSLMWKRGFPRIATVVLANVALWVLLTQLPGWDFLTHPQAWLIPPAVCVLAVAHWQREQLDSTMGAAIRYAATLVIYVSSTADMLLGEIGSSLWGPVVLIALSLAGMLVGVVMRIKPFLYLGTIFVFLGVTSMVWHAGQAIDAVWPWWVFGISSGLVLLSALAGIEKHRDKLQRWSDELSRWEN